MRILIASLISISQCLFEPYMTEIVTKSIGPRIDSVPGEYVNDLSTYLVLNGYAGWLDRFLQDEQDIAKGSKMGFWSLGGLKLRPFTWRKRNWKN